MTQSNDHSASPVGMGEAHENGSPSIDSILGHFFDGSEVHIVFCEADGRQFIMCKESSERSHITFLKEGCTWSSSVAGLALHDYCDKRIAIHEAGHAVITVLEGIKVEYVTVVPFIGSNGAQYRGLCQIDYRLAEVLKTGDLVAQKKKAKRALGGPAAETLYWCREGKDVPEEATQGWSQDLCSAKTAILGGVPLRLPT
jgi:hypothetical protein